MKLRQLAVLFFIFALALPAMAQTPQETVKIVYKLLYNYDEKSPKANEQKQEINQYFLLYDMAREAVKNHWSKMSERQKNEYMNLMYQLLEKAIYRDTHENLLKGKVKFKGERVQGARAKVLTNIYIKTEDMDIDNDFDMKKGNIWQVKDMFIDGASLIEDYQSQFNKIIAENGIDKNQNSLFARLKNAVSEEKDEWRKNWKSKKSSQDKKRTTKRRPTLIER